MDGLKFYCQYNVCTDSYDLYGKTGHEYRVEPIVMTASSEGSCIEPMMKMDQESAQMLMNTLWDAGIRPAQGKGSAGQMEATQRHLEDMRQIAFKKLGM